MNNEKTMTTADEGIAAVQFDDRMASFLAAAQAKATGAILTCEYGPKYIRVVRSHTGSRSAHCFVDRTNGNVLKPAGWKGPAKGARSNIFSEDFGASGVTEYGAAYAYR